MPLEAALSLMYPLVRSPKDNVLQIKVFSVPPYPYKKEKKNPDPDPTESTI
jgi:hypothetical protein